MAEDDNIGVLIFKGMRVGFLQGEPMISIDENGQIKAEAILSTSYNVLPLWLRIAHDNVALAKTAFENIADQWNDDPVTQRRLLLAELTPSIQAFVACGIAYDAFYEQIKPFATISESDADAWKRKRTSRAAQISEVIRRVYKLNSVDFTELRKTVVETIKWRDSAVHPSHELKQSMKRSDLSVGVDWRFSIYRYENAATCYANTIRILTYLYKTTSPKEKVNENMSLIFEALKEMGLVSNDSDT